MLFCDGTENGQAYGVITPNANTSRSGFENRRDSLLDAQKSVLDGKRIDREIAKVRDAMLCEGIYL